MGTATSKGGRGLLTNSAAWDGERPDLLLVHASSEWVPSADEEGFAWIFIGRDASLERQWGARLGRARLPTGPALAEIATELKGAALRLRSELAASNDPIAFHSSMAFELNGMASPLFSQLCFLELIRRLVRQHAPLLVVAQDGEFVETVALNRDRFGVAVRAMEMPRAHVVGPLLRKLMAAAYAPIFALVCLLAARLFGGGKPSPRKGACLLRTWVDAGWAGDGTPDRYLPGLAGWLRARDRSVLVWVVPSSADLATHLAVIRRSASASDSLTVWHLARPSDIVRAAGRWLKQANLRSDVDAWEGWSIRPLLAAERRRFALQRAGLSFALDFFAVARLREAGVEIRRIVFPFENMFPQKPFVMGVRRAFPSAAVVGYQHSVMYPNQLVLFHDESAPWGPEAPDVIVSSGRLWAEQLLASGYPAERIREGPALRFEPRRPGTAMGRAQPAVLVPLPLTMAEAEGVWSIVSEALRDLPIRILVKPHPMMAAKDFTSITDDGATSGGVRAEAVDGTIESAMKDVDLVIATASGVLFDAVLAGVPVVRLKSHSRLDFDPLDGFAEAASVTHVAFSSDEVRASVLELLQDRAATLEAGGAFAARLSERLFSKPSDDYSVFLT